MMHFNKPLLVAFCIFVSRATVSSFEKYAQSGTHGGVSETIRPLRHDLELLLENDRVWPQKGFKLELGTNNHAQEQVDTYWPTYSSMAFGFAIKYPPTYAVFEERPPHKGSAPKPIYRVYFRDKARQRGH